VSERKPEVAFVNDRGCVMVADDPSEPNLVREYVPKVEVEEAVAIMRDARGHYGIEEASGPGRPATEWDEIADRMKAFVHRYG
jgi:hypothetical protein